MQQATVAAAKFWAGVKKHFFEDELWDLDYSDFLDLALSVGLLQREPYDEEKHGIMECDPGDVIYVPTSLSRDLERL